MIGWEDVYKVVAAMVPLYVALILGYGSVRWWHMFTREQCDAINKLACYFVIPLFVFEFACHVDPSEMNYRFIAADAMSKLIIAIVLVLWSKCSSKGSYDWFITCFSLSSLNNTLVVGVPLIKAMYDQMAADLVVQSCVLQSLIWNVVLLFMLELRRAKTDFSASKPTLEGSHDLSSLETGKNLEGNINVEATTRPSFWLLMKIVWTKLAKNPNAYGCILGVIWALSANRLHIRMPSIIDGSILIMSRAGGGISMFSMGLFTAMQEKIFLSGVFLTLLGLVLRFVVSPAIMAMSSVAVGLQGEILRVSIIQAALPQAIASFVFAKEYELHASLLSTAVIFGTIVSLPVLISYYAILEVVR